VDISRSRLTSAVRRRAADPVEARQRGAATLARRADMVYSSFPSLTASWIFRCCYIGLQKILPGWIGVDEHAAV
jgi:hypothetical protein